MYKSREPSIERRHHGVARAFAPAKLIIPALLSADADVEPVEEALEDAFGALDYRSEEIPFTFTDYYNREMGEGIRRIFFAVADLFDSSELAAAKLTTDALEQRFARDPAGASGAGTAATGGGGTTATGALGRATATRRRRVNLDPGVLSLGRLILASTKDNAQRIPLRDGIYAEITLLYRRGAFEALPWTYPDFRSATYHRVLREIRGGYKEQLEAESAKS